jgi:hypothetical protein
MAINCGFGTVIPPVLPPEWYYFNLDKTYYHQYWDQGFNPGNDANWTYLLQHGGAGGQTESTLGGGASPSDIVGPRGVTIVLRLNHQRSGALDRAPFGAAQITGAKMNLQLDDLRYSKVVKTYRYFEEGETPEYAFVFDEDEWKWWGWDIDQQATNQPIGALSLGFAGMKLDANNQYVNTLLMIKGGGSTVENGIPTEVDATDVVKAYLDQRLNYDFFEFIPVPPNQVDINSENWESMIKSLFSAVVQEQITWEWKPNAVQGTNRGQWVCFGTITSYSYYWGNAAYTSPLAKVDLAGWNLPSNSRVHYGRPPAGV